MEYTIKNLTPDEAKKLCPICRKYGKNGNGFDVPMCLYYPQLILDEEKPQCLFAKHIGKPIIQVHCDICGQEIKRMRFIDGVHRPPKPTVNDLYICIECLKKPESQYLREMIQKGRKK